MKLLSKTLTAIVTVVGAVGTFAGIVMFAAGGTQFYKTQDMTGKEVTVGTGWLNYNKDDFKGISYSIFLEEARDKNDKLSSTIAVYEKELKRYEEELRIAEMLPLNDPAREIAISSAKIQINTAKLVLDANKMLVNVSAMYDVSVAGVVIMSLSIAIAALSAVMAIKVEN